MNDKNYFNLVKFWDSNFKLDKEDKRAIKNQIDPDDFIALSPSKKQFDCLMDFKTNFFKR